MPNQITTKKLSEKILEVKTTTSIISVRRMTKPKLESLKVHFETKLAEIVAQLDDFDNKEVE